MRTPQVLLAAFFFSAACDGKAPKAGMLSDAERDALAQQGAEPNEIFCDSIHAVKIARELQLPDCHQAEIELPVPQTIRAAGAGLPRGADTACEGRTANGCAQYFRDEPSRGLLDDGEPQGDRYAAYHYGTAGDLRLSDGTRPLLYYKRGAGTHERDWIIFLQGGAGMCATDIVQNESPGGGSSSLGAQGLGCYDKTSYSEQGELTAGTGFRRERYRSFERDGILGENPNNAFKDYNRVYLMKSNDLWLGNTTLENQLVEIGGFDSVEKASTITHWYAASIHLRGNDVVAAALDFLSTPPAGVGSLRDARSVMFVSSSSGTNAIQRVDAWSDQIGALTDRAAYVGMMANSSAFTADSFTLEKVDEELEEDDPPRGQTLGLVTKGKSVPLTFGTATWRDYRETTWDGRTSGQLAPGTESVGYASVGALLDESCVAAELAEPWKCRSPLYVMRHHLGTPLFVAHSLRDQSNSDGVVRGVESRASDGTIPRWNTVMWVAGHANFGEAPMESLARLQFRSWAAAPRTTPLGLWAPDCTHHEPEKHDDAFATGVVEMGDPANNDSHLLTLNDALRRWFEERESMIRIDGNGSSDTVYPAGRMPAGCQAPTFDGH